MASRAVGSGAGQGLRVACRVAPLLATRLRGGLSIVLRFGTLLREGAGMAPPGGIPERNSARRHGATGREAARRPEPVRPRTRQGLRWSRPVRCSGAGGIAPVVGGAGLPRDRCPTTLELRWVTGILAGAVGRSVRTRREVARLTVGRCGLLLGHRLLVEVRRLLDRQLARPGGQPVSSGDRPCRSGADFRRARPARCRGAQIPLCMRRIRRCSMPFGRLIRRRGAFGRDGRRAAGRGGAFGRGWRGTDAAVRGLRTGRGRCGSRSSFGPGVIRGRPGRGRSAIGAHLGFRCGVRMRAVGGRPGAGYSISLCRSLIRRGGGPDRLGCSAWSGAM